MQNTLPRMWWSLMDAPSIRSEHCLVCGCYGRLEQHHVVYRSAGKLFRDGKEVEKPTLTLCGFGNNLYVNGRMTCHGAAHSGHLHFRYVDGEWQFLLVSTPMKHLEALAMEGWRPLCM